MLSIFYKDGGKIQVSQAEKDFHKIKLEDVVWIDLVQPSGTEKRAALIAPMKDGRIMGDYMLEKLAEVLADYDFDGWHAADGIAAPWNSIIYPMDSFIRMFAEKKKWGIVDTNGEFVAEPQFDWLAYNWL